MLVGKAAALSNFTQNARLYYVEIRVKLVCFKQQNFIQNTLT
jgi:hypothetical protein